MAQCKDQHLLYKAVARGGLTRRTSNTVNRLEEGCTVVLNISIPGAHDSGPEDKIKKHVFVEGRLQLNSWPSFNFCFMINITLKRRADANPVAGQNISLEFAEPAMGWTKIRCTDASGIVSFPVDSGNGTLFINGYRYLSGWLSENLTVFIDRPSLQPASPLPPQDEAPEVDAPILDWEIWG